MIGIRIASSAGRIGEILCPLVAVGFCTYDFHQTASIVLFEILIFSCIFAVPFPFETKGCELSDTVSSPKHIAESA
ncbi:hypothetical protein ACB092_05G286200 [Castanea dentata]